MVEFSQLLIASGNGKKVLELRALLAGSQIEVLTPEDVGGIPEVEENRDTFTGNASKKAAEIARATSHWCLADDSGLEVDHLEGAPGVYSARFCGRHGDDEANNALLLEKLVGVPEEGRGARFVCALALARPDGEVVARFEGSTNGSILTEAKGEGGFGYDPLFQFTEDGFPQTGQAFATLTAAEKAAVSHRGRALKQFLDALSQLNATQTDPIR